MSTFNKLVDQVDDAVFNTVSEYLEDVMGEAGYEYNTTLQEKVLVALLKKYRPENVIFVEEEESVPEQVIYGVFTSEGTWLCDVSGSTEGELFADLVDAMNAEGDELLMEYEFNIGDDDILFECRKRNYSLKKK